jgi:hypothetical protein
LIQCSDWLFLKKKNLWVLSSNFFFRITLKDLPRKQFERLWCIRNQKCNVLIRKKFLFDTVFWLIVFKKKEFMSTSTHSFSKVLIYDRW